MENIRHPLYRLGANYKAHPAVRPLAAMATLDLMEARPCDWFAKLPTGGLMLGNDTVGDCWPVARRWCITVRRANAAGDATAPTTAQCVGDYTTLTGYDPTTGQPDDGTDTDTAMASWATKGVRINDQVLDIVHPATVDPRDDLHVMLAIQSAGPCMGTWRLPMAMQDLSLWSEAPGTGVNWNTIWGDHETALGATDGSALVTARTWGQDLIVHPDIRRRYLISIEVPLDLSPGGWLEATGLTPFGLDQEALAASVAAMTA